MSYSLMRFRFSNSEQKEVVGTTFRHHMVTRPITLYCPPQSFFSFHHNPELNKHHGEVQTTVAMLKFQVPLPLNLPFFLICKLALSLLALSNNFYNLFIILNSLICINNSFVKQLYCVFVLCTAGLFNWRPIYP